MRRLAPLGLAAVVAASAVAVVLLTRDEESPKPAYRYEQFTPPWEHTRDVMLGGRVVDAERKPVAGVYVGAAPVSTLAGHRTGKDGRFVETNVSDPGLYQVRFSKCGFKELLVDNVRVRRGVMTIVDVTLEA